MDVYLSCIDEKAWWRRERIVEEKILSYIRTPTKDKGRKDDDDLALLNSNATPMPH